VPKTRRAEWDNPWGHGEYGEFRKMGDPCNITIMICQYLIMSIFYNMYGDHNIIWIFDIINI
jgi:hypothetical protein